MEFGHTRVIYGNGFVDSGGSPRGQVGQSLNNQQFSKCYCKCLVTLHEIYRPPSALSNSLSTLMKLLSQLKYNEIVLVGDLNWD